MMAAAVPVTMPVNHVPPIAVPIVVASIVAVMVVIDDDHSMRDPAAAVEDMAAPGTVPMAVNDDPSIVVPAMIAAIVAHVALLDADVSNLLVPIVAVGPSIVDPHVAAARPVRVPFGVIPAALPVVMAAMVMVAAIDMNRFVMARMAMRVNDASGERQDGEQSVSHIGSAIRSAFEFMPFMIDPNRTGHARPRGPELAVELFMGPCVLTHPKGRIGNPFNIGAGRQRQKKKAGSIHGNPP